VAGLVAVGLLLVLRVRHQLRREMVRVVIDESTVDGRPLTVDR
jgi:hypothetical protein